MGLNFPDVSVEEVTRHPGSSRSLIGVANGEGGPALAQAKHRALGRELPGGWWVLPVIVLGAAMWTGVALAICDVAGWL